MPMWSALFIAKSTTTARMKTSRARPKSLSPSKEMGQQEAFNLLIWLTTRGSRISSTVATAVTRDDVLPDGPTALGHPTNEDLFGGTPVRAGRSHGFLTCLVETTSFGPRVGRVHLFATQREPHACFFLREKVYPPRSGRPTRSGPVWLDIS